MNYLAMAEDQYLAMTEDDYLGLWESGYPAIPNLYFFVNPESPADLWCTWDGVGSAVFQYSLDGAAFQLTAFSGTARTFSITGGSHTPHSVVVQALDAVGGNVIEQSTAIYPPGRTRFPWLAFQPVLGR